MTVQACKSCWVSKFPSVWQVKRVNVFSRHKADTSGFFEFNFSLNYSSDVGLYNVTAYDYFFRNLNDTSNFTVIVRNVSVITDLGVYGADENVLITGLLFSLYSFT